MMPLVPLTTGASSPGRTWPIIGPPISTRVGVTVKPPQNSTRSAAGVPIGTTTLRGLRIAPPPTVTTRDTSGLPKRTARHTASAVPTLCTLTPISAESLPAGISRPVTVVTSCFSEPIG